MEHTVCSDGCLSIAETEAGQDLFLKVARREAHVRAQMLSCGKDTPEVEQTF